MTAIEAQKLRLLVVEDDESVRFAVEQFLLQEGHEVTAAATAEEGLARLRVQPFHCIISDCIFRGGSSGLWMLAEAARTGHLHGIPVILMTGGPLLEGQGVRVLRKPFELEALQRAITEVSSQLSAQALWDGLQPAEGGARVELVLYVHAHAPASESALRNLKLLLLDYEPTDVGLTVCDVSSASGRRFALVAGVFLTPTLVKADPAGPTQLTGVELTPMRMAELLRSSGARERDTRAASFRRMERSLRDAELEQ